MLSCLYIIVTIYTIFCIAVFSGLSILLFGLNHFVMPQFLLYDNFMSWMPSIVHVILFGIQKCQWKVYLMLCLDIGLYHLCNQTYVWCSGHCVTTICLHNFFWCFFLLLGEGKGFWATGWRKKGYEKKMEPWYAWGPNVILVDDFAFWINLILSKLGLL